MSWGRLRGAVEWENYCNGSSEGCLTCRWGRVGLALGLQNRGLATAGNCRCRCWVEKNMIVRPTSFFQEDLSKRAALSEERYGSVDNVFMLCGEDASLTPDYQRWMVNNSPMKEVMEINSAYHMPMLSKPRELCQCIAASANSYIRLLMMIMTVSV
ncbi:Methylesterase 3 [Platanthera zijinensis]|uniref:Methylesterase 3 n=1 Tax=Platanthera zijinensis TaxID=2320716 RepID=A0AAP0B9S2_9ASPA